MGWRIALHCDTSECDGLTVPVTGASVKAVAYVARLGGWKQDLKGLWRCPVCGPSHP